MRAMLLAAGLGERMLPLTRILPKPVLPVLGRPLATIILQRLASQGVAHAVVNLHHDPDKVRAVLGDGTDLGLASITYSHEEVLLGTAGGLRRAAQYLRGGDTILVRNADFLSSLDLTDVTATHLASGCPVTLVLAPYRPGYTPVHADRSGRVVAFGNGSLTDADRSDLERYMFTGLQLLEAEVLDRIPDRVPSDLVRDLYVQMAREGRVAYHVHEGFWWEFGNPTDYLNGSLELISMDPHLRAYVAKMDPVESVGSALVAVGAGADFHHGVELKGRVALGFASLVAEGSCVEESVVLQEAWIGPGCHLRRTIVAPGVEVPAGFRADQAVLCPDPGSPALRPKDAEVVGSLMVTRLADQATARV